jgi:hypothetical protein
LVLDNKACIEHIKLSYKEWNRQNGGKLPKFVCL